jgi:hypothetical protein
MRRNRDSRSPLTAIAVAAIAIAMAAPCSIAAENTEDPDLLSELTKRMSGEIPEGWSVVETEIGEAPIGWTGEPSGLYLMAEDSRIRFFHPNGFHYYSFYRIWLMPAGWEGVMKHTPYVSDSVPAYLLGANDDFVAFYHTAGGNVWPEGLETLCSVLRLERVCYTDLTRRIVDLEVERRLTTTDLETAYSLSPQRIVGLAADGPNLYLEYVFPPEEENDETDVLAALTDRVADSVFTLIPEAESLYLRRCTSDTYTDTIVTRN